MKTRTFFLLFVFCLSLTLTACGRRLQNNQPTLPAPMVATETSALTTLPNQPTIEPPTEAPTLTQPPALPPTASAPTVTPFPAATATPESDPAGDAVESLLQQLDDANAAADQDIQSLTNP